MFNSGFTGVTNQRDKFSFFIEGQFRGQRTTTTANGKPYQSVNGNKTDIIIYPLCCYYLIGFSHYYQPLATFGSCGTIRLNPSHKFI